MKWFANLRMGAKLMTAFGVMALLTATVGYVGMSRMSALHDQLDVVVTKHALGLNAIVSANVELIRASRGVRNAILDDEQEAVEKRIADIAGYRKEFSRHLEDFTATIVIEANRQKAQRIADMFKELIPQQDAVLALARQQKDNEAKAQLNAIRAAADAIDEAVEEMQKAKLALLNESTAAAQAEYLSGRNFVIAFVVGAVILAVVCGVFLTRLTTSALKQVMATVQTAATGDLRARVTLDTKDELGQMAQSLNGFMTTLHDSIQQVADASQAVTSASSQLAASAEQISTGAQQQASSLEETAASLEEMTSTVKQNADNAQQARQLAGGASDVADRGGHVVSETVEAMTEINRSSKKIADIITTIDEIAFQTNLLALNAAVEAARAGEQGRGFAVVAAEVRNLAQRSATAAKEIKGLIQDSVRKVENGTTLVNKSGETLTEIVTSVKHVTDIVAEIAAASKEQSAGIEQVNTAVTQMDQVTQTNAAQTEELSSTATGLQQQAEQLRQLVDRFTLHTAARAGQPAQRPAVATVTQMPQRPKQKRPRPASQAAATPLAKTGTTDSADGAFEEF